MALTSYMFRNQPYWLGFLFAGQAFTVSYRCNIRPGDSVYVQISTGKDTITHMTNRTVTSEYEQLGIKLLENPMFRPGKKQIPAINLDGRSKIQAETSFYSDASDVYGGVKLEESMIPRSAFYGGTQIESALYERILQYDTNYVLVLTNEGTCSNTVVVNMAFYESGN